MIKHLTKDGFEKLKKELAYLKNVKRKEVAKKINLAAAFGDISENAAYDAAKEEQGFLEGRIAELTKTVSQAEIIKSKRTGKVQIGSFVQVALNSDEERFQLVEPEEADVLEGKISYKSPLGERLLGQTKGSKIVVFASGKKLEYKVLAVE
jgi:transcription elongation factor GreA